MDFHKAKGAAFFCPFRSRVYDQKLLLMSSIPLWISPALFCHTFNWSVKFPHEMGLRHFFTICKWAPRNKITIKPWRAIKFLQWDSRGFRVNWCANGNGKTWQMAQGCKNSNICRAAQKYILPFYGGIAKFCVWYLLTYTFLDIGDLKHNFRVLMTF